MCDCLWSVCVIACGVYERLCDVECMCDCVWNVIIYCCVWSVCVIVCGVHVIDQLVSVCEYMRDCVYMYVRVIVCKCMYDVRVIVCMCMYV